MPAKLFIPFFNYRYLGGPATFMRNLKTYLDNKKYRYTQNPLFAKGIFFPMTFYSPALKWFKLKGGAIIQRLDGIYYPTKHGEAYKKINAPYEAAYNNYSTKIIFQSEYSRAQCFEMFGEKTENDYALIYNGVHKNVFYPNKNLKKSKKIRFITTGSFRNIDMIAPVVNALDLLKGKFDFELTTVGPIKNEKLEQYFDRDYIDHTGAKKHNEIAEFLRNSDVFIYSHLNPPCPNSVLEAISCGLPVVGFDSGAMSELCFFSKELLAPVNDKVFQEYKDFDYKKLAEKIEFCADNYSEFKEKAMERSHLYSFEECGRKYVEVFDEELRKTR